MASIKSNYSNFAALKSDLNINGILDFYPNGEETEQCWIMTDLGQVCITCPLDLDNNNIAVMSSTREFTIEKKKGQTFLALWVYNPSEIKTPSSSR